jgi:hypothetical protein
MTMTKVMLAGGPPSVLDIVGVYELDAICEKLKISYAGGYEHFISNGEFALVDGEQLPIFEWCLRTKVAE